MNSSSARLDSAVFQLTPTRTRFDLVITVNGKKEKIATGLLNPFLSHLKSAQDQMAKGGYSIVLIPEHASQATWFTRGTVERFVRYVSTPEILERVYTIESEILQIEEAIAIQGNKSTGTSIVEENQIKQVESTEGTFKRTSRKTKQDISEEKAIVLYKSDAQSPEANGSTTSEGNSKVQILKVLETRKSSLQKEQGMTFARAVAAGFDVDYMSALMAFGECFKASRLVDACRKFMSLWKRKHESGQWLEIEAAEVTPNRADFSAISTSGIVLSNRVTTSHTDLDSENNGKTNSGYQENIQGQFPHHGFSPWPVHSAPSALPVFQPYAVQGIPYYQTYPGNSPFMQTGCPPVEDSRHNRDQSMGHRRHSSDNRHNSTESETWDMESSKTGFQDEVDTKSEGLQYGERQKKASRPGRQKSGMVVIRNINYITKTERSSVSGSYSDSASETDEDKNSQESMKTSKRRGSCKESLKRLNSSEKEKTNHRMDADGGHWQAFQNCLLRGLDEDTHAMDQDQFELEKVDHERRRKHVTVNDPFDFTVRDMHEVQGGGTIDLQIISKGLPKSSNDDLLLPRRAGQSGNLHRFSDVTAINGQNYSSNNLERKLFHNDDSYIVECRSVGVLDAGNTERNAINMHLEHPKVHTKEEKEKKSNYQLDELSLMPERGAERESMGYDPAFDYEIQAQAEGGASQDNKNKGVLVRTKAGSKMLDTEQKSRPTPNSSDKRKSVGPIRRGKASKPSPLDEARVRAERLRNYKADLQKMKKEKEEEEIKRLDALKMERQKRIAARRSSSITTNIPMPSQLTKKHLPAKLLPSSHRGSKFSDSEPGSSSPFQRFPIRTASVGSNDSSKASKTSRLNSGSNSVTRKLSRSVPSLIESKQEKANGTTNSKASMARIRRLSEPKMSSIRQTSSVKVRTNSMTKVADETRTKKISAIVNHDKSKTATLPELKIKISKASNIFQDRSSIKEKTQKLNGNKSSMNSEGTLPKKNEILISHTDDGDDNPIIEKTVVMLECENTCACDMKDVKSREKSWIQKRQYDNEKVMVKNEKVSSYVAVHASVSPRSTDIEASEHQSRMQPMSTKVKIDNIEKEPSRSSNICVAQETYHAPYARVSSLEDPCTRKSEYGKTPPTSLETASFGTETFRTHVSDTRSSTLEKIPEVNEKPLVKDPSKGLRRLLKFGRKNHNSATAGGNLESDIASVDGSETNGLGSNGSSNEVHSLKNLLSRDETPTTSATPQKSSRSFSLLLSPFRSNIREKKIMMA